MSEHLRPEGLSGLEAALAGLSPLPPALDRDRLLFRAGQESRPRRGLLWPWSTGVLAAVAAGLGALLVLRPEPAPTVRIVYVPVREEVPAPRRVAVLPPQRAAEERPSNLGQPTRLSAFQLQRDALRWGIEALPLGTPPRTAASPDQGPIRPPAVPTYYQLRSSLQPGGAL
jgi:hypothetical protein